jgi:hypothetical protein
LIRIVNTYAADLSALQEGNVAIINVRGLVALRDVFGQHTIELKCRNPEGNYSRPLHLDVPARSRSSPDETNVVNIELNLPIQTRLVGRYSLDVFFDGELLAQLPFTLKQRSAAPLQLTEVQDQS